MKTFKHQEPEWHCKCSLKKYDWWTITSNRITITVDNQLLGTPATPMEECAEAVQMIYPMSFWVDPEREEVRRYKCRECQVYPHRIVPNPFRKE